MGETSETEEFSMTIEKKIANLGVTTNKLILEMNLQLFRMDDDYMFPDRAKNVKCIKKIIKFMLKHGDPNNMFGHMVEDYTLLSILITPFEEFKKHKKFEDINKNNDLFFNDSIDDDIEGSIYEIVEGDVDGEQYYLIDKYRVKIDTPISFLRSILIEDAEEEE